MGIEGTCDGHQVLYGSVGSLHCTPETNIKLYVSYWNLNKNLKPTTTIKKDKAFRNNETSEKQCPTDDVIPLGERDAGSTQNFRSEPGVAEEVKI